MSGLLDAALYKVSKSIPITELQEHRGRRWITWMVDDPPQWEAMKFYASQARGRVLCGGLGLTLVQNALASNPNVTSVTTVEQSSNVIKLSSGNIPEGQHIIHGDLYRLVDGDYGYNWDTIIADIWTTSLGPKMAFYYEVARFAANVKTLAPQTRFYAHGFTTVCDTVWPISKSTRQSLQLLAETNTDYSPQPR